VLLCDERRYAKEGQHSICATIMQRVEDSSLNIGYQTPSWLSTCAPMPKPDCSILFLQVCNIGTAAQVKAMGSMYNSTNYYGEANARGADSFYTKILLPACMPLNQQLLW
jgi:hypothetical protein